LKVLLRLAPGATPAYVLDASPQKACNIVARGPVRGCRGYEGSTDVLLVPLGKCLLNLLRFRFLELVDDDREDAGEH
jgi:hypothetical protein